MNKTELSAAVGEAIGLNHTGGAKAVNAVFDIITETLAKGQPVIITGFGKFEPVETKPRTGRNPRTGESIDIPVKTVIKFRPGKTLIEITC